VVWSHRVKDVRLARRHDPADELGAQRDADTLADFFLDTAGGGHLQLPARLVEHRTAAVSAQRLSRPAPAARPCSWPATGMAGSDTLDIGFPGVTAEPVTPPAGYTSRPGFSHGGAGVAACWYGGARAIEQALATAAAKREVGPHALAHLGAIDLGLRTARAALRQAADEIDADPKRCDSGWRRDRAAAITLSPRLGHDTGANGVFAALAASGRGSGGQVAPDCWWGEGRCAATWGEHARPDGYDRWTQRTPGARKSLGSVGIRGTREEPGAKERTRFTAMPTEFARISLPQWLAEASTTRVVAAG
jgi:Replication-relaxation